MTDILVRKPASSSVVAGKVIFLHSLLSFCWLLWFEVLNLGFWLKPHCAFRSFWLMVLWVFLPPTPCASIWVEPNASVRYRFCIALLELVLEGYTLRRLVLMSRKWVESIFRKMNKYYKNDIWINQGNWNLLVY